MTCVICFGTSSFGANNKLPVAWSQCGNKNSVSRKSAKIFRPNFVIFSREKSNENNFSRFYWISDGWCAMNSAEARIGSWDFWHTKFLQQKLSFTLCKRLKGIRHNIIYASYVAPFTPLHKIYVANALSNFIRNIPETILKYLFQFSFISIQKRPKNRIPNFNQ